MPGLCSVHYPYNKPQHPCHHHFQVCGHVVQASQQQGQEPRKNAWDEGKSTIPPGSYGDRDAGGQDISFPVRVIWQLGPHAAAPRACGAWGLVGGGAGGMIFHQAAGIHAHINIIVNKWGRGPTPVPHGCLIQNVQQVFCEVWCGFSFHKTDKIWQQCTV